MRALHTLVTIVLLLLTILTMVFVVFSVVPSDPVRNALGLYASEAAVDAARNELGLDRPLAVRYATFLRNALTGQWGRSIYSGQEVRELVLAACITTVRNGTLALAIAVISSLALIGLAAVCGGRTRGMVTAAARMVTSFPGVVVALSGGVVAYSLLGGGLAPTTRATIAVVLGVAAYPLCSLTEIGVMEARRVGEAPFVTAARAMGFNELAIFVRVTLRIILVAWTGQLSNLLSTLLVSSAVFEAVSSVPGLGDLLARSVLANDLPVVQAIAVVVVMGFLIIDFTLGRWLAPRVSLYGPHTR